MLLCLHNLCIDKTHNVRPILSLDMSYYFQAIFFLKSGSFIVSDWSSIFCAHLETSRLSDQAEFGGHTFTFTT